MSDPKVQAIRDKLIAMGVDPKRLNGSITDPPFEEDETPTAAGIAITNPSILRAVPFSLQGGGDRQFFLAPIQALEWCLAITPGPANLPISVREALIPFLAVGGNGPDMNEKINITSGSADNDAALFLSCLCRNFDTIKQALDYAKAQGWEIAEEEYEGCIY